jgi:hypothetical protein
VKVTVCGLATVLDFDPVGEESDDSHWCAHKVTDSVGWEVRKVVPPDFNVVGVAGHRGREDRPGLPTESRPPR